MAIKIAEGFLQAAEEFSPTGRKRLQRAAKRGMSSVELWERANATLGHPHRLRLVRRGEFLL